MTETCEIVSVSVTESVLANLKLIMVYAAIDWHGFIVSLVTKELLFSRKNTLKM